MDRRKRIGRTARRNLDSASSRSGIVRPLDKICDVMDGPASGNLAMEVSYRDQRNEIGRISRSLGVFKDALVDAGRLCEEKVRRRDCSRSARLT